MDRDEDRRRNPQTLLSIELYETNDLSPAVWELQKPNIQECRHKVTNQQHACRHTHANKQRRSDLFSLKTASNSGVNPRFQLGVFPISEFAVMPCTHNLILINATHQ